MKTIKIGGVKKTNGRPTKWTEPKTNEYTLAKGTILYHASDKKINSFAETETCFYTADNSTRGFQYLVELTQDVSVEEFGTEEVRFEVTKENCKVFYRGTREVVIDFDSPCVWTGIGNRAGWERQKKVVENFI